MQPQRIVVEELEASEAAVSAPRARPREAHEADGYAASPALALQQSLAAQLNEPYVKPWPAPVRLTVIIVSSAALWTGIVLAAAQVAKAF